jgi:hypothetical protein
MSRRIMPSDEKARNDDMFTGRDVRPMPDPTVLTTQQLLREILAVRELFETRLVAYDRAIVLLQATVDKSPTIAELHAMYEERFRSAYLHSDDRRMEIMTLISKQDSFYTEKFRSAEIAVSAAIAASDKQTASTFAASEKAISKAEEAQRDYNVRSNEFRAQLDDQAKRLISRIEAQAVFKSIEDKIDEIKTEMSAFRVGHQSVAQQVDVNNLRTELMHEISSLREYRSEARGSEKTQATDQSQKQWTFGSMIAIGIALFGWVITIVVYLISNAHEVVK